MSKIKRAILIAAGEGRRLRPVTLDTPKPLVKVNGKRIIDGSIEALFENGIEDIYIVVGYKKEQFRDLYAHDSRIHIIENNYYLEGNNITSMYLAREFLPEAFVLEADIIIRDKSILAPQIEKSGYFASKRETDTEWRLDVVNGRIQECDTQTHRKGFQLWGISMWNREDGEKLADLIQRAFENGVRDIYWDEIALCENLEKFNLGIREISEDAIMEVDTFQELTEMDASYKDYR